MKSADFFGSETNPQIKFTSKKFGKDPWGNQKAGFTLSGKIKRTDFGLNWNAALETGAVLVGEEVRRFAEIQLVQA